MDSIPDLRNDGPSSLPAYELAHLELFNSLTHPVWLMNFDPADKRYIFVNQATAEAMGSTREEVFAQDLVSDTSPAVLKQQRITFDTVQCMERTMGPVTRTLYPHGVARTFNMTLSPLRVVVDGTPRTMICVHAHPVKVNKNAKRALSLAMHTRSNVMLFLRGTGEPLHASPSAETFYSRYSAIRGRGKRLEDNGVIGNSGDDNGKVDSGDNTPQPSDADSSKSESPQPSSAPTEKRVLPESASPPAETVPRVAGVKACSLRELLSLSGAVVEGWDLQELLGRVEKMERSDDAIVVEIHRPAPDLAQQENANKISPVPDVELEGEVWMRVQIVPVTDAVSGEAAIAITETNITDIKRAQASLKASELKLQRANKKIAEQARLDMQRVRLEFQHDIARRTANRLRAALHYLSHETRNHIMPLQAVASQCEQAPVSDNERALVASCTTELDRIMDSVSLVSKLYTDDSAALSSMVQRATTKFSLRALVDSVVSPFQKIVEDRRSRGDHIVMTSDCNVSAAILDSVTNDINVNGPEQYLHRVLTNLLSNAVKFTDGGKVSISVNVSERREDPEESAKSSLHSGQAPNNLATAADTAADDSTDMAPIGQEQPGVDADESAPSASQFPFGRPPSEARANSDSGPEAKSPGAGQDNAVGNPFSKFPFVSTSDTSAQMDLTSPFAKFPADSTEAQVANMDLTSPFAKFEEATSTSTSTSTTSSSDVSAEEDGSSMFPQFGTASGSDSAPALNLDLTSPFADFPKEERKCGPSAQRGKFASMRINAPRVSGGGIFGGLEEQFVATETAVSSTTEQFVNPFAPSLRRSLRASDNEALEYVQVDIQVTDTGCGIDAQEVESIFTPFAKLRTGRSVQGGGSGLGLPIANKLAELLQGSLSISSSGSGTNMSLSFPIQVAPQKARSRASSGLATTGLQLRANSLFSAAKPSLSLDEIPWIKDAVHGIQAVRKGDDTGQDVLVVEDNALQCKLYRHRAKKANLRVHVTPSAFEALDLVQKGQSFGFVVLDLMMDEMMGDEVCRRLKELGYDGTMVCVSGNAFSDDERHEFLKRTGFAALVTKGSNPSFFSILGKIGELANATTS